MFQLCDVLQLIVDGLDDNSLVNEDLVGNIHLAVLRIVPHLGDKRYAIDKQFRSCLKMDKKELYG